MDPEDVLYVDVSLSLGSYGDPLLTPLDPRHSARQFDGDCLEYLLNFFEKSKCVLCIRMIRCNCRAELQLRRRLLRCPDIGTPAATDTGRASCSTRPTRTEPAIVLQASYHSPARRAGILRYPSSRTYKHRTTPFVRRSASNGRAWKRKSVTHELEERVRQAPPRSSEHIYRTTTERQSRKQRC